MDYFTGRDAAARERGSWRFELPDALGRDVLKLAKGSELAQFLILTCTLKILLAKYLGTGEILLAAPRYHPRAKGGGEPGWTPLFSELEYGRSFKANLLHVRQTVLEAYSNQNLTMEEIAACLGRERENPAWIAEIAVAFEGLHDPLPDLEPSHALTLCFSRVQSVPDGTALGVHIQYDADRYLPESIARLADQFCVLLTRALAFPDLPLTALDPLDQAERERLLFELNQTTRPFPLNKMFIQVFQDRARQQPDATAVTYEHRCQTYADLKAEVDRRACALQAMGIGPEALVLLWGERDPSMMAAILATFKVGGAYVPADPAYPEERLLHLIRHSGCALVLVSDNHRGSAASLLSRLEASKRPELVPLARFGLDTGIPIDAPEHRLLPNQLAYVIYTSGSTGQPKGVMVEQRGMLNHLYAKAEDLELDAADTIAQNASQAFDISVWQFLAAPLVGGKLSIVADAVAHHPAALKERAIQQGVTILEVVPSLLSALPELVPGTKAKGQPWPWLRRLLVTGEALPPELCRRWLRIYPSIPLVNAYGPTECSDDVSHFEIPAPPADRVRLMPIGKPVGNIRLYALDPYGLPVPHKARGELYVGGVGVGRGYKGDSPRTAAVFLPDPFAGIPGSRLYRTGDRVRLLGDGNLEFLGRLDGQVKMRGYRIELGEIEETLCRHAGVMRAAVLVREDAGSGKNLVAYVTTASPAPEPSELKNFLAKRLPEYMLPAVILRLPAFPLLPNGKINRAALPKPELSKRRSVTAPRNDTEKTLLAIWREVLAKPAMGIHDNFFEWGGDSILSIHIVSKAHAKGLELMPNQLFEHQTVAQLSGVARPAKVSAPLERSPEGPVPLTPIQSWFFDCGLKRPHHFNQTFLLEWAQPLSASALEAALRFIASWHDALRLRFRQTATGWEQWPSGDRPSIRCVDLDRLNPEASGRAITRQAAFVQSQLDFVAGPLFRVVIFRPKAPENPRLLIAMHHLVIDIFSWRILREDLWTVYRQTLLEQRPSLPPQTTSFREWAAWLAAFANGPEIQAEWDYWRNEMAALDPAPPSLPRDQDLGPNNVRSIRSLALRFSIEETETLLRLGARRYRAHADEILIALLVRVFQSWTGDDRVWMEVEGHGRESLERGLDLTRGVGWFASLFPLVVTGAASRSGSDSLKLVKEKLRPLPHGGIGFGLLRYATRDPAIRTWASSLPRAEISVNYFGQMGHEGEASGPLAPARENAGPSRAQDDERPYLLEVGAAVVSGGLRLTCWYSENKHARKTIDRLAHGFRDEFHAFIQESARAGAGWFSPSDFSASRLSAPQLDVLRAAVLERGYSPEDVEDLYDCSPLQQGLLFHALFAGDSGVYIIQSHRTIYGPLDLEILTRAWRQILERHAILRSSFYWEGLDQPQGLVHRQLKLEPQRLDWSALSKREQQRSLADFLERDRAKGFDLTAPPLMRLAFIKLDEVRSYFVWSFHHLLLDGWSSAKLTQEVVALYMALLEGRSPALEPVWPYREFILWLHRQDPREAEEFWRKKLKGFQSPTPLGMEARNPASDGQGPGRGLESTRVLSRETTALLESFAKRHQLTLSTLTRGGWSLLMGLYAGERDILHGVTVAGRPASLQGSMEMVGLFINSLPCRVLLRPERPFMAWLTELQKDLADTRRFEYVSLPSIHGWSEAPREQSLFACLFVFENYRTLAPIHAEGGEVSFSPARSLEKTHYPLTLVIEPRGSMVIRLLYGEAQFDKETMDRLLARYETVLKNMASNPNQALGDMALIEEQERLRLLHDWNDTGSDFGGPKIFWLMFQERAARGPDHTALAFGSRHLDYAQLDEAAMFCANRLRAAGVVPETRVGVLLERGPEAVAAMLAIQAAGGVYLPFDPAHPPRRMRAMAADAGMGVLITQRSLSEAFADHGAEVLYLEDLLAGPRERNPGGSRWVPARVHAGQLAYMIFTSGSTGRPKGVAVSHAGLYNLACSQRACLDTDPHERVLQFASPSFDASIFEMVMALGAGAALCLGAAAEILPGGPLGSFLDTRRVTLATLTPSALAMLPVRKLPALRKLTVAGEACPSDLVERWSRGRRFYNLYGPTEAAVWSTMALCEFAGGAPSIGRPIPNSAAFVLNERLQPLPPKAPGELCLAGKGLARGYFRLPALTAAAFVPHPHAPTPGDRLYRTGDRSRFRLNGELEFLGRLDHQVKIRGVRIETGEIEAVLNRHPEVVRGLVTADFDGDGQGRLAAYVVCRGEPKPTPDQFKSFLREALPESMVPPALMILEKFPLLASGKIDRGSLPEPETGRRQVGTRYAEPATEVEKRLAALWRRVLKIEKVGAHDNFFDLGGHSLHLVRIHDELQSLFQQEIHLTDIFHYPTVHGLAGRLLARKLDPASSLGAAGLARVSGTTREEASTPEKGNELDRLQRLRQRRQNVKQELG